MNEQKKRLKQKYTNVCMKKEQIVIKCDKLLTN